MKYAQAPRHSVLMERMTTKQVGTQVANPILPSLMISRKEDGVIKALLPCRTNLQSPSLQLLLILQ